MHKADMIALAWESRDLFNPSRLFLFPDMEKVKQAYPKLIPLSQNDACVEFIEMFSELTKQGDL